MRNEKAAARGPEATGCGRERRAAKALIEEDASAQWELTLFGVSFSYRCSNLLYIYYRRIKSKARTVGRDTKAPTASRQELTNRLLQRGGSQPHQAITSPHGIAYGRHVQ